MGHLPEECFVKGGLAQGAAAFTACLGERPLKGDGFFKGTSSWSWFSWPRLDAPPEIEGEWKYLGACGVNVGNAASVTCFTISTAR
jgi:hypothetical protein